MRNSGLVFFVSFIAIAAILSFAWPSLNNTDKVAEDVYELITYEMEAAYFDGQRDAIEGDIRIELNEDSVYVWSKTPWNDGKLPLFNPAKELTDEQLIDLIKD